MKWLSNTSKCDVTPITNAFPVVIGKPQATDDTTVEELTEKDIVGLYVSRHFNRVINHGEQDESESDPDG